MFDDAAAGPQNDVVANDQQVTGLMGATQLDDMDEDFGEDSEIMTVD